MERKNNKALIILFSVMFLMAGLPALSQQVGCFFRETYAKGNLDGWEAQIYSLEKQYPGDFDKMTEALTARYGYMGYLLGQKENSKVRKLLDETEKLLDEWLKKRPGHARLLAIRAGLIGFRIGLTPLRAPMLGQRNLDAWESAIKNDPNEPMGWLEKGNSLFYRPAMFGGDKKEAEAAFRKALQLSEPSDCDWIYSFIQVRLYEACKANGKSGEAESIRKKLQEKPGHFKWLDTL